MRAGMEDRTAALPDPFAKSDAPSGSLTNPEASI